MQGLNISQSQRSEIPKNLKHEIITVPATSQIQFGSYGVLDFKENVRGVLNHDLDSRMTTLGWSSLSPYSTLVHSLYLHLDTAKLLEVVTNSKAS